MQPITDNTLSSPSFVVDLDRARANAARMLAFTRAQGVGLRPHVKTHKTLEGMALQVGDTGDTARIVVSTLREVIYLD